MHPHSKFIHALRLSLDIRLFSKCSEWHSICTTAYYVSVYDLLYGFGEWKSKHNVVVRVWHSFIARTECQCVPRHDETRKGCWRSSTEYNSICCRSSSPTPDRKYCYYRNGSIRATTLAKRSRIAYAARRINNCNSVNLSTTTTARTTMDMCRNAEMPWCTSIECRPICANLFIHAMLTFHQNRHKIRKFALLGAPKSNTLGKIRYLRSCSIFRQIYGAYRRRFRHIFLQISDKAILLFCIPRGQLTFITKNLKRWRKSCAKFDSIWLNIQDTTTWKS